jgi:hypothetical protein
MLKLSSGRPIILFLFYSARHSRVELALYRESSREDLDASKKSLSGPFMVKERQANQSASFN